MSWYLIKLRPVKEKLSILIMKVILHYFNKEYDKTEGHDDLILKTYFSEITDHDFNLKKITFPSGNIVFNYSSEREDLKSGSKLTDIIISNDNAPTTSYNLNYYYSNATNSSSQSSPFVLTLEPEAKKTDFE
jgi:hypothetical protein